MIGRTQINAKAPGGTQTLLTSMEMFLICDIFYYLTPHVFTVCCTEFTQIQFRGKAQFYVL